MSSPGWNLKHYLKNELCLPKAEVRQITRAANQRSVRSIKLLSRDTAFVLGVVAAMAALLILLGVVLKRTGFYVPSPILSGLVGGIGGGLVGWWMAARARPFVFAELRRRGHNVCPKCGYLRAGLEDTQPCPECGTKNNM